MNIQNKKLIIVFIVIYITSYQATAEESGLPIILETNVYSLINKDIISHVDTNRLDIRGTPQLNFFWSPDERKVIIHAFINAYTKGGKPNFGGVDAVYLLDISQINSPKLIKWGEDTNNITDDLRSAVSDIRWSPSGKYFSFLERSGGPFRIMKPDEKWTLWIINASTLDVVSKKEASPEAIGGTFQRGYSWSPAEDKIAYIGFDESKLKDIFIWDVSENGFYETRIKEHMKYFEKTSLTWSPDGRKLALAKKTFGDKNESLLIIDLSNKKIINLFSAPKIAVYRDAFWSPDSKNILISEIKPDDKFDVYLVDVENREHKILKTFNNSASSVKRWSNDSKKIVFFTSKPKNEGGIYQFYSMATDGSSPVLIFENEISLESVDISGNFTVLAFRDESYKMKKLIVIENEKKRSIEIHNVSDYVLNYKIDSLLYVSESDGQNSTLFTLSSIAGKKQISILPDVDILSFSPSGNFLIVETRSESTEKENSNRTNSSIQEADRSKSSTVQIPGLAFIFLGILVFVVHHIIKIRRF